MTRMTLDAAAPKADGHTLTFLANSGTKMADNGLTVDLPTLRAPLSDGSLKLVTDLTDTDPLTLPLLVNHEPDVYKQAGTVTKLWITTDGLMAEAHLSDVPTGQMVQQLAKDGALTNSFSITIDYDRAPDKNGVIRDAELVEISVVYRGADSKAAFRSINSKNGGAMADEKSTASFKLTADENAELKDMIREALSEALSNVAQSVDKVTEGDTTDTGTDTGDGEAPAPATQSTQSNSKGENKMTNTPVIINKANTAVQSVASFGKGRKTWLDSDEAFNAFERNLLDSDNLPVEKAMKNWADFARGKMSDTASFGIDAADVSKLIPTEAVTVIEDALNTRGSGIWNALRKTGLDRLTIGGNIGGLTDATRAHGYPVADYGTEKTEQTIAIVKRTLEAEYTYKYITLNKGDIRRTQRPGALLRYVLSELPNYIVQTIERQAVLGGYTDMAHFRSIIDDSKDTTSEWRGDRFALKVEHGTSSVLLYDFVRAAYKVTAPGAKILVTGSDILTDILLSQDAEGRTLIDLGAAGVAARLGVSQIITPEWWTAEDSATALGVVFTPANYSTVGDTSIEAFTNFALKTNTNEYLQEIFAGGGLSAEKSAAVVVPTTPAGGDTGRTTGK